MIVKITHSDKQSNNISECVYTGVCKNGTSQNADRFLVFLTTGRYT